MDPDHDLIIHTNSLPFPSGKNIVQLLNRLAAARDDHDAVARMESRIAVGELDIPAAGDRGQPDIPLEMNILGMGTDKQYPSERFFRIAGAVGNRVVLGLDAHCVDHIYDTDSYYKCLSLAEQRHVNLVRDNILM